MASVDVQFDMTEVNAILKKMGSRPRQIPMSLLGEGLVEAIDDLIESEGDGQWDPLSATTLKLHPRRQGGKLLQDTGLLSNIQQMRTGADFVEVGSPAPYAFFHVSGAQQDNIYLTFAPHELPKRDFLAIDIQKVLEETGELVIQETINR